MHKFPDEESYTTYFLVCMDKVSSDELYLKEKSHQSKRK